MNELSSAIQTYGFSRYNSKSEVRLQVSTLELAFCFMCSFILTFRREFFESYKRIFGRSLPIHSACFFILKISCNFLFFFRTALPLLPRLRASSFLWLIRFISIFNKNQLNSSADFPRLFGFSRDASASRFNYYLARVHALYRLDLFTQIDILVQVTSENHKLPARGFTPNCFNP